MSRGGFKPGGGASLRALAIKQLRHDLDLFIITSIGGLVRAPGTDFSDYSSALIKFVGIRNLGVPQIRFLRKKLALAFQVFRKPDQQLHLNEIESLLNVAEANCKARAEKRTEKRKLRAIVNESKPTVSEATAPPITKKPSVWD